MGGMYNIKKNKDAGFYIKYHLNYVERSIREKTRGKTVWCPLPSTGP